MKNKVQFIIFLFFGLAFLVYLFPFIFVEAAKLQSGVTINAPSTDEPEMICDPDLRPPCRLLTNTSASAEPEEICNDTIDNDNDGKIDAADEDCAAAPAEPAVEICDNGKDDNKNGKIDEPGCVLVRSTCGVQILSGVPINYGKVSIGQDSTEQKVTIKNVGTATATVLVKGGSWVVFNEFNHLFKVISPGPEDTHVATTVNLDYSNKKPLSSSGLKLGGISGGQSIPVYFQLRVPTTWPIIPEGAWQEVSIDLLCGGNEFLKEDEIKSDYNTSAKTPNTPSPLPIPYPDTNNTQIRAD